jgi:hypothetical protein
MLIHSKQQTKYPTFRQLIRINIVPRNVTYIVHSKQLLELYIIDNQQQKNPKIQLTFPYQRNSPKTQD